MLLVCVPKVTAKATRTIKKSFSKPVFKAGIDAQKHLENQTPLWPKIYTFFKSLKKFLNGL